MQAASFSACRVAFLRKSSTSTLPSASAPTTTTLIPHICAEAGLVPWAEEGIRQTVRCVSPRAR